MLMWLYQADFDERTEIMTDPQESLDDIQQTQKIDGSYIRFDDLETIASHIMVFKDSLRLKVEEQGGIQYLAALTGIP